MDRFTSSDAARLLRLPEVPAVIMTYELLRCGGFTREELQDEEGWRYQHKLANIYVGEAALEVVDVLFRRALHLAFTVTRCPERQFSLLSPAHQLVERFVLGVWKIAPGKRGYDDVVEVNPHLSI